MQEDESRPSDSKQGAREELLAARAGDQQAGNALLRRHGASMLRTAWRVLGRHASAAAEDVVQEAFIAALATRALPSGDVGAWFRAISARKALDWLRAARRRGEEPLPPEDASPSKLVDRGEQDRVLGAVILREGLDRLSAPDRAVLTLVDLEGWPMAEAARMLEISAVAIRLRAVRARRKLARFLRAESEAGDE